MRLLFFGDMAGTGFGTVTADLGRALLKMGEDVRFLSINETGGKLPEPFASRTFSMGHDQGWLYIPENEEEAREMVTRLIGLFTGASFPDGWVPDAAILLGDPVAVKRSAIFQFVPKGFPVFHYVPIEGVGLPPRWKDALWGRLIPVAMCEFGADEIEKVTGSRPPVIYHGVDSHVFHPISPVNPLRLKAKTGIQTLRTKADARRFFVGDTAMDRIWLLRTDRHMPRKRYNSMLRALVPVMERNPKVDLVIHCRTEDQGGDLRDALSKFPEWVSRRVILTGLHDAFGGVPREVLVALYNAADLYVSNCAEGFGLCLAEALACGLPAVGARFASVPEVIGPAGVTVAEVDLFENEYDYYWGVAQEEAFATAVEGLVNRPLHLANLGAKGADHVRRNFRWDTAARQFVDIVKAATRQESAA
jgi:glycosyltransferase involved in cell wall biosynthesis